MALNKETKTFLVWSTVVAVLSVGGYLTYRWWKNRPKNTLPPPPPPPPPPNPTPPNPTPPNPTTTSSSPFKNVNEIKAFQDWLDINKPFWITDTDGIKKNIRVGTPSEPNRHVNGKGYGNDGVNTKRAYANFGSEYLSALQKQPSALNIPSNLQLILNRLGNRAMFVSSGTIFFVKVLWNHSNKTFEWRFFDNNRFVVLDGSATIFRGNFLDGGRTLTITEDNYSRVSKVGTTFKTDGFWTTGEKLFTDKKQ